MSNKELMMGKAQSFQLFGDLTIQPFFHMIWFLNFFWVMF